MSEQRTYAEMTDAERSQIRSALDILVMHIAAATGLCPEAVANEAFYWIQRRPTWGRNATKKHKRASHAVTSKCFKCGKEVALEDATFHHLRRGIPDQHSPANLVPSHVNCHDAEHNAKRSSLMKGSPRRRTKRSETPG